MNSLEKLIDNLKVSRGNPFFSDSDKIIHAQLLELAQCVKQMQAEPTERQEGA